MKAIKTIAAAGVLLGATSVMAQLTDESTGKFRFTLEGDIKVDCTDAQEIKDKKDMVVASAADLKDAEAEIECMLETNLDRWSLGLIAENGGKMARDTEHILGGTDNFLQVKGSDGILGMWVEFTEGSEDVNLNTVTSGVANSPILENGEPTINAGRALVFTGVPEQAKILATEFGGENFESDKETIIRFIIKAAFVDSDLDKAITSTVGSFVETVTVKVAEYPIS